MVEETKWSSWPKLTGYAKTYRFPLFELSNTAQKFCAVISSELRSSPQIVRYPQFSILTLLTLMLQRT